MRKLLPKEDEGEVEKRKSATAVNDGEGVSEIISKTPSVNQLEWIRLSPNYLAPATQTKHTESAVAFRGGQTYPSLGTIHPTAAEVYDCLLAAVIAMC